MNVRGSFITACAAITICALAALAVIIGSLLLKFAFEYLNWLTTWSFI